MAYRLYAPNALDRRALAEKNRNAPEGMRYCNALCADYLPADRFSGIHTICNQCRNMTGMADRKIRQNQFTAEEFIENPSIVYGEDKDVGTTRVCGTCKQEKSFHLFEFGRRICKSCRHLRASEHNKKKIQGYLRDIEELKTNIPMLENFCQHIPKDCLIVIISHYQVGRKATDPKSTMVFNLVQHFRGLLDPGRCGRCGCSVVAPARVCGRCEDRGREKTYERRQEFMDSLETTFDRLKPLDPGRDRDLFTKDQLSLLARRAELDFRQTIHKNDLFDLFNAFLLKREQERERKTAEEELERRRAEDRSFPDLVVDQFRIQARASDGYINATQLCKAGGKRFADWYRMDSTKEIIDTLLEQLTDHTSVETDTRYHTSVKSDIIVVDIQRGGNNKTAQGSWIHPDLAVQLAQWVSPLFGIRVSRWVREILTTGHASFDARTNEELIRLQREQEERKRLETNHKRLLQKREYHKFGKGPCFYIIRTAEEAFKIGFDGVDVNERFRTYRTSIPEMKVLFMIFSPRAQLIEENMLARYGDFRVEQNHEFLKELSLSELTGTVDTMVNFLRLPHQAVSAEEIALYNDG